MLITVWKQDFRESVRLRPETVAYLHDIGVIKVGLKPNSKGRLKPVYISIDALSKIRGLSAQMPARVTELNAQGSYRHVQIVEAWKPRFASGKQP